jgi:hypothetical protein
MRSNINSLRNYAYQRLQRRHKDNRRDEKVSVGRIEPLAGILAKVNA